MASDRETVRVEGRVEKVTDAESDAYFDTRPLESRWSVYASRQSDRIESREALESRYDIARQTYGDAVTRPHWWGGYRVVPDEFEFWQGRPSRLHDRLQYSQQTDGSWLKHGSHPRRERFPVVRSGRLQPAFLGPPEGLMIDHIARRVGPPPSRLPSRGASASRA